MNENESNNLNKVNLDKNSDVSEVKNPINEISVPENSEVEISVQENPEIENSVQENTENDEISLEGRQNRLEEKIKELDALPENPISTEGSVGIKIVSYNFGVYYSFLYWCVCVGMYTNIS